MVYANGLICLDNNGFCLHHFDIVNIYYLRIRRCQTNHAAFFSTISVRHVKKASQHHQHSKIHQSTVNFARKSPFTAWHSSQMTSLAPGGCLLVLRLVTFDLQHALQARRHRIQQRASLLGVQADLLFLQRLPHRLSWPWLALLNPRLPIQPGVLNGVQVETATRCEWRHLTWVPRRECRFSDKFNYAMMNFRMLVLLRCLFLHIWLKWWKEMPHGLSCNVCSGGKMH